MQPYARAQEWPLSGVTLPESEKRFVEAMGVQLIVPIGGGDRRLDGLLLLGRKKSEQPYSAMDKRLLERVATQIATLCENVVLKDKVASDRRFQQDVLAHLPGRRLSLLKECPACGVCYDGSIFVCEVDATQLHTPLPIERIIDGRYRLDRVIGKGGMGAVYRATDLGLARTVAVKVMVGQLFGDPTARRRFEREARVSATLNHPNIVTVYDYGEAGAEGAYLVMELLEGATLRAAISGRGAVSAAEAARWFDQVFEGIKLAHSKRIVHRDLKPENIFLSNGADGHVVAKLLDFGLAKTTPVDNETRANLTVGGAMIGTLGYMSPEQLRGETVDDRSDVFSLALVIVETLTGFHPFPASDATGLVTAILTRPLMLRAHSPDVEALYAILTKCLAKNREERPVSISEMQRLIIPALQRCAPLARPDPLASDVAGN